MKIVSFCGAWGVLQHSVFIGVVYGVPVRKSGWQLKVMSLWMFVGEGRKCVM